MNSPDDLFTPEATGRKYIEAEITDVGIVRFRSMTAGEVKELRSAFKKVSGDEDALSIINSVCNEAGHLIYTEEHIDRINSLRSKVIDEMTDVIAELSFNNKSIDDLVKEAEKNSESDHGE